MRIGRTINQTRIGRAIIKVAKNNSIKANPQPFIISVIVAHSLISLL
jgi:hypothetical protein